MKNPVDILHSLADAVRAARLARLYTAPHDNVNPEDHIREALGWLLRAQDAGDDRGVSWGAAIGGDFLPSYPETTGYIIPTFLELADRYADTSLVDRAVAMGEWEIDVQLPCGAVMGGRVGSDPRPAMFNTGQVLLGWSALVTQTGSDRFRDAGRRAADWMIAMQDPDGDWSRGNSAFAASDSTLYNVGAAWGLCLFGMTVGDERYVEAARRNATFTLRHQRPNGWFERCCLTDPSRPLTHTLAYTARGLLEIGVLTERREFVEAARWTADAVRTAMREDGFLAGRFDPDWRAAVSWCCLTGSAQTSIIFSRLAQICGETGFRDAAARLNRYVMVRHDVSSPDPRIRGGLPGSWPVTGDYGRLMIVNWAVKFLIDALLEEQRAGMSRA